MKITYDKKADAAYIYLLDEKDIEIGWVSKTYTCDPSEINGMINLDFDKENHLGGIEVMDASKKLPKYILDLAEATSK